MTLARRLPLLAAGPFDRIRRNHAIEHATVAILLERRRRPTSVYGLSDFTGFHLRGAFSRQEVESAAMEALERLRGGHAYLAITNNCGTNLVITGILTASAALLATIGRRRRDSLQPAITAATFATMAAVPAGRWVQRTLTTDPRIGALRLKAVREYTGAGRPHFKVYLSGY